MGGRFIECESLRAFGLWKREPGAGRYLRAQETASTVRSGRHDHAASRFLGSGISAATGSQSGLSAQRERRAETDVANRFRGLSKCAQKMVAPWSQWTRMKTNPAGLSLVVVALVGQGVISGCKPSSAEQTKQTAPPVAVQVV